MTEQRFVVTVEGRRLDPLKIALALARLTNPATDRVLVEGEPGDRAYVIPRALVGPAGEEMQHG